MKIVLYLVTCCLFYNSVSCSSVNKEFDDKLEKQYVTSGNVSSFEQRLTSIEEKISLILDYVRSEEKNNNASNSNSIENISSDLPPQKNCKAWFDLGFTKNAVYNLDYGSNPAGIKAWCDMESGGYTVLMKRYDGSEPFNRPWSEYRTGFGKRDSEYWIGLENIYELSRKQNTKLRVEMKRFTEETIYYAEYSNFFIDDEASYYRLHYGDYSGNAGDGFTDLIQGMRFSTYDRDLDMSKPTSSSKAPFNCAVEQGGSGGWWFNWCSPVCLTGKYLRPGEYEYRNEIYWYPLTGNEESLEMVEMKIYEN